MKMLSRGGHQKAKYADIYYQKCQEKWNHASQDEKDEMLLAMALVEAQTGFFNLGPNEFRALQTTPSTARNQEYPRDNYGDIANNRPPELKRLTHKQFMQLRKKALEEAELWLGPVVDSAAPAPTPTVPAPAPSPTSHAARVPAPAASWGDDAEARNQQANLLEQLNAGLTRAAAESAEIDQLVATLTTKQAEHKETLTNLQRLQQQIAAANQRDGC